MVIDPNQYTFIKKTTQGLGLQDPAAILADITGWNNTIAQEKDFGPVAKHNDVFRKPSSHLQTTEVSSLHHLHKRQTMIACYWRNAFYVPLIIAICEEPLSSL